MKEEYAFKFMILFYPFRNIDDLRHEDSFQKKMQIILGQQGISEEMFQIADNIQDLHNSLASTMPTNKLDADTTLLEQEEPAELTTMERERSQTHDNAQLIAIIETLIDSNGDEEDDREALKEDAKVLNPKHGINYLHMASENGVECGAVVQSCSLIHFSEADTCFESSTIPNTAPNVQRFVPTITALNTLAMTAVVIHGQILQ
jgi:hypothetical protein